MNRQSLQLSFDVDRLIILFEDLVQNRKTLCDICVHKRDKKCQPLSKIMDKDEAIAYCHAGVKTYICKMKCNEMYGATAPQVIHCQDCKHFDDCNYQGKIKHDILNACTDYEYGGHENDNSHI